MSATTKGSTRAENPGTARTPTKCTARAPASSRRNIPTRNRALLLHLFRHSLAFDEVGLIELAEVYRRGQQDAVEELAAGLDAGDASERHAAGKDPVDPRRHDQFAHRDVGL